MPALDPKLAELGPHESSVGIGTGGVINEEGIGLGGVAAGVLDDEEAIAEMEDDDTDDDPSGKRSPNKRKRDGSTLRKAPQAPKRFKSSYICFFMAKQSEIKDELGDKATVTEISKKSAEMWRNLPAEERAHWDDVAAKDKQRYMVEKASYTGPWQVPWKRARKDPSAPKRPMSAFLYFSQGRRRQIKEANPKMKNTEVSRMLGEMWRNAPEAERKPHIDKEKEEREKYKVAIADWRKDYDAKIEFQKKAQADQAAYMATMYENGGDPSQQHHPQQPGMPYHDPNAPHYQYPSQPPPHMGPPPPPHYGYSPYPYPPHAYPPPGPYQYPQGKQPVILGPNGAPRYPPMDYGNPPPGGPPMPPMQQPPPPPPQQPSPPQQQHHHHSQQHHSQQHQQHHSQQHQQHHSQQQQPHPHQMHNPYNSGGPPPPPQQSYQYNEGHSPTSHHHQQQHYDYGMESQVAE